MNVLRSSPLSDFAVASALHLFIGMAVTFAASSGSAARRR